MNHLDLFSGIGGFALAAQWAGFETVAFCEIEDYPRKVLKKNFPGVPIHRDIRELNGEDYAGTALITGGYPCQPFSLAGKRGGAEDDRHLWPEMFRIVKQARPDWVVAENVFGHINMGLDQVLSDLEGEGYSCRPVVIPACAVDAPHRRDRVWIIANARGQQHESGGDEEQRERAEELSQGTAEEAGRTEPTDCGEITSNANTTGPQEREIFAGSQSEAGRTPQGETSERANRWPAEPDLGRGNDGLSSRLDRFDPGWSTGEWEEGIPRVATGIPNLGDRLKGLGNAIVPQVAYQILKPIGDSYD